MNHRFESLAVPGVRGLQPYQPGKPVAELEREFGLSSIIKLASNENPLGPSPSALAAATAALLDAARYPDGGGCHLRGILAARHGIDAEMVTLGNGSNDVLELVARAFVTPEDEVIYSAHAFAVYPLVTRAIGARAVVTPACDWGHDVAAMGRAFSPRTRLIFIANPNNPTGTWVDAVGLERLLEAAPAHALVLVDEAYFEYVSEPGYPDCTQWLDRYPNLIVTRTFSKAFGLAGLRIGYAVSGAEIAELLNRVRQPFNVSSVSQAAAMAALDDSEHRQRSVTINGDGLRQLAGGFDRLGLDYVPSVANFLTVELPRPGSVIFQGLLAEGVIVRPLDNYAMPDHVRVTVGLEVENTRFLEALGMVLHR